MSDCNEIINAVRATVKSESLYIDISDISEILPKHKCFYLLAMMAKTNGENRYLSDMAFNKAVITERYKTCVYVFEAIQELPYAVIKGAVLSQAAYGDMSYRKSADVDLLVSRENVDKLTVVMRNNGFIQGRITDSSIVPFTRQEILFHFFEPPNRTVCEKDK